MTESTKEELQIEYGDLLQQLENTFDWFDRRKIISKLNSICELLDIPKIENPNCYNKIKKFYL